MNHELRRYKTRTLLTFLTAFLEMQCIAVRAKMRGLPEHPHIKAHLVKIKQWNWIAGICCNLFQVSTFVPRNLNEGSAENLLRTLFAECPSSGGRTIFPVETTSDNGHFCTTSPNVMWGDHPYADNRRKIITECIEQLQTELRHRGVSV